MGKYIVTIAPPTPNGNLHLGHISGPFLAADIFNRIRRLKNDDVIFVCYSDDYQDYVVRKAMQQNMGRFELATHFANRIDATLKKTNIHLDWFLKAYQNDFYKDAIAFFYKMAAEKGVLASRDCEVPYSAEDNVYGYEAFARGTCNYCGEDSDPSQCEACANSPVMEKMGDLLSIFSQKKMGFETINREYLRLDHYKDYLKNHFKRNIVREELQQFVQEVISNGELDWYIDRPRAYGIDVEINGETKIIHTWFSGLAGYYAATKEYAHHIGNPGLHDEFWKSTDTRIVNFLGFDCSFSHAIVYPSLLSNAPGHTANWAPITNRFLKLEGGDFSTSRGHAIWVDDILEEVSSDALRYYLAIVSPEYQVENFEKQKFMEWLDHWFNPFIEQLGNYMEKHADEFTAINFSDASSSAAAYYRDTWNRYTESATFSIGKLAQLQQEFLQTLKSAMDAGQSGLGSLIQVYLVMGKPIHPELSEKLISLYNIKEPVLVNWLLTDSNVKVK